MEVNEVGMKDIPSKMKPEIADQVEDLRAVPNDNSIVERDQHTDKEAVSNLKFYSKNNGLDSNKQNAYIKLLARAVSVDEANRV